MKSAETCQSSKGGIPVKLNDLKHNRALAALCIIFVFLVLSACGGGGGDGQVSPPPPEPYSYQAPADQGDGWAVADAGTLGLSVSMLESMMDAMPAEFDIVDSVAISYRGKLVLDETLRTGLSEFDTWVGNTDPGMHILFSASKSIASIAVGIAIDQGFIAGVDVPYLSLFPYPSYDNWDARKDDLLLEDVLTMRLGLDWNEWDPPYSSPDNRMFRFYEEESDYSKALLDLPMTSDPGTTFAYNTAASVSLGQAIENNSPVSLIEFGFGNLLGPLNISQVEVLTTPTDLPDLGRGLYLHTRDFLKFGQLFANGGTWNGQRLVSESWVNESTRARVALSWSQPDAYEWKLDGYAYQWWTGYFEFEGREIRTFAARGYGQQVLMVIPELDVVVAVFSHAWNENAYEVTQVFELINRFVIPAVL